MANLADCLNRAVDAGELDRAHAEAAKSEYEQLVERYASAMPRPQAEATAARDLREATQRARRSRQHAVLNQLQSLHRLRHVVETSDNPDLAIMALLEPRLDDGFRGESVRFIQESISARIRSDLRELMQKAGLNVAGSSRSKPLIQDTLRELHGQDTANAAAKAQADAVRQVQGWLRQMFNAHGGDIGELADYGVRHTHDASKLRRAGEQAWIDAIYDRLDWSRIIDKSTGKPFVVASGAKPFRDSAETFLRRVYENITTEGWNAREPSLGTGAKALYNQRAEPRLLHFIDGDAWMDYNAEFGATDLFSALVGGLDAMGRDIGLMKVLGPNPNTGLEFAIQTAEKIALERGNEKLIARTRVHAHKARVMLRHLTGGINNPVHETLARVMSNVRHFNVAARLGAALLSSTTDLATVAIGAATMGRNPGNVLGRAVKLMASSMAREEAARAGFVAETLMSIGTSSARLTNDVVANDVFGRLSGFTIRASGLSYWTDQMRVAVQMDVAGHLASNADRALGDVDAGLRQILERAGITEADWDTLRAAPLFEPRPGATFLTPEWFLEHQTTIPRAEAESLALRLGGAFQEQLELLVPTKRYRGVATLLEGQAGTLGGEFMRSTLGFKNYAISFTIGQIALFNSLPTPLHKAGYLATGAVSFMVLGAVALQNKEISKGRDPRPMDDPAFWLAAVAQGGGLGIFGDFFFSEQNRFGGGLAETLAGPVVGLGGDVTRAVSSNVARAANGEDMLIGRDVANLARQNTPVLSSLWYARTAFDRYVADELQRFLDPDAEAYWKRQERRQERTYGNQSWWRRGERRPDRAPDLSNMGAGS